MEYGHDVRLGRPKTARGEISASGIVECAIPLGISRGHRFREPHWDGAYREATPLDDGLLARRDGETRRRNVDVNECGDAVRYGFGEYAADRDHETRTRAVAEIQDPHP